MISKDELAEHVLKERLKAWIYSGVETEIELHQLRTEQNMANIPSEDKKWNQKRITKLEATLALVNDKIKEHTQ